MNRLRLALLFFLPIYSFTFLNAAEPFFSGEEKLYSSRTGKLITTLNFSIEVNASESPENYLLTIGNKSGITGEGGTKLSLWIFNKMTDAKTFAKNNSSIDVNNIHLFDSFCKNAEAKFSIFNARKIENIAVIPFDVNGDPGSRIELMCNIYIASHKKSRTTIDDEARIKIVFTLPHLVIRGNGKVREIITLEVDHGLNSATALTPEELEKAKRIREDSTLLAKIRQLDLFISEKNTEIEILYAAIDSLLLNKIHEKRKTDSLENLVNVLKKKVDLQEMGNVTLFPNNDGLMNKFTEFSSKYSEITKKIDELKKPPAQKNFMVIGIVSMLIIFTSMFILQIWNQIKSKRQQRKHKKEMEEASKKAQLDSLDNNDLDKI